MRPVLSDPSEAVSSPECISSFVRGEHLDSSGPAVRPLNSESCSATVSDTITSAPDSPLPESPPSDPSPQRTRAEQSRLNGAKGRGPTSKEGKARASRNAVTHGLTATFEGLAPEQLERFGLLMPEEDPETYRAFLRAFVEELKPVGVAQGMLAERAATLAWKLRRLPLLETFALRASSHELGGFYKKFGALGELVEVLTADDDAVLTRLHRYEGKIERSLRLCLRELRWMQDEAEKTKDGDVGGRKVAEESGDDQASPSATVTQDVTSQPFSDRTAGPLEVKDPPNSPPISGSFCQPQWRGTPEAGAPDEIDGRGTSAPTPPVE